MFLLEQMHSFLHISYEILTFVFAKTIHTQHACTTVNYSATNHCTEWRDITLICLVMSVLISMTLDGVMFSRIENL